MKAAVRLSLLTLFCVAPLAAFAEPAAPSANAAAQKKIAIQFRGNLRDALQQIAQKGGLNLVVTGNLSQDAEVYLQDVTAEDALRTVAQAYNLKLQQSGRIWTLRPLNAMELSHLSESNAAAPSLPTPPVPPSRANTETLPAAPNAPNAPAAPEAPPPLPALPEIKPGMSDEAIEQAMRQAEQIASRAEAEADAAVERAEAQADALRDSASDRADQMREHAEALREQAQEMKERAKEARENAAEARQQAKQALRSAKRALKQKVGFTGPVTVKEGEVVEDAVAYGGPLDVQGHVKGDAVSFGGDVTLGPKSWVEGDVVSFGGGIHREDGSIVEGDVQAMGGAVVGKAVKDSVKDVKTARRHDDDGASSGAVALAWFVVLFVVGFIANLAVPERMRLVHEEIRRSPVKAGLTGFLATLAMVPLTVLLCVTIVGIPVAILVLWPVAVLACLVGVTVIASELGMRIPIFRGRKTQALVLAVGLLFVVVAAQIPVVGPLSVTLLSLVGFGAIVRTRFGGRNVPPSPLSTPDIPSASAV